MQKFEFIDSMLSSYKNIIDLVGKKSLGVTAA
jgi:hypothetical protein